MKKEDIELWDWNRILFGNAPPIFMLEVFLRTLISFFLLLTILRLLGKKMKGQLNLTEMAVIITLGAIISVPMQTPDRGILVGVVALLCILALQRLVNWSAVKRGKLENITQGKMAILVRDGVLDLKAMARAGVSKQDLFGALRQRSFHNLAEIKRVYFEACGILNIYPETHKKPGLAVYPSDEHDLIERSEKDGAHVVCKNCGVVADSYRRNEKCPHCGEQQWMTAIY